MNKNLFYHISDDNFQNLNTGTFYLGVDPTGDGAHIGHLIPMRLAIELLKKGFKGILLIGGFTGGIGDPTDKNEARKKIEDESIQNNSGGILNDFKRVFSPYVNQITIVNNKDWLEEFSLKDYLNISYHISITRKLNLETFNNRLANNLSLSAAEFMYPDMQMIDFLYLQRKYGCNIQIGGADQWGNIAYGVHYVKKISGNKDIYGICTPLLTSAGKKISKSEGKPALIRDSFSIYQHCINMSDDTVKQMYDLFLPQVNISNDYKQTREVLAQEILNICFPGEGDKEFEKNKNKSESIFYEDIENIPEDLLLSCEAGDIATIINDLDGNISKSEVKRKITEGGITINNDKINDNIKLESGKYKIKIGTKKIFCIKI